MNNNSLGWSGLGQPVGTSKRADPWVKSYRWREGGVVKGRALKNTVQREQADYQTQQPEEPGSN